MSKRQVYRGNPEEKIYTLINDFSGGMNTVDVDDVVKDNEFRELINVELSTKGLLQNRKGFGELVNFNNIIKNKLETFPQGTCYLFKVFKDDNRLLEVFDKFSEEDFETHIIHNKYDLRILLVIERTVYYLTINKEIGEDDFNVNLETKQNLPEFTTQKKALTNINTVDYLDKIYFSLSDISSELVGIGVFDTEKEEFSIIDNENCYKPTPYEITNHEGLTGFNVLAKEPLTHIKIEETGLKSILGVFITDMYTGITLEKIPPNGNFDLKVIYTGTDFDPYEIGLTFTNQNEDELNYTLGDLGSSVGISVNDGYFIFHIRNLDLTNSNWVEINLEKKENIINVLDEYNLINFLGINQDTEGIYLEEDESLYIKTGQGYFKKDFTPFKPKRTLYDVEVIEGDIEEETVRFNYIDEFLIDFDTPFEGYVRLFNSNLSYIYKVVKDVSNDLLFKAYKFETWKDVLPTPTTTVVFVESTQTYHTLYWEPRMPMGWQFRELNSYNENEIYNPLLGQHYEIGESANKEQIKGIDLTDVNLLEIDDRLVYYKGNTIWFSELGQFDYLPNRNYVMLPLKFDDKITNIHYFRGSYIVFTKQKIFKMSGKFETQDFRIEVLNEFVGCIAPKSVRSISNYLYFMSREGLYRLYNNAYSDGVENVKKVDELLHGYVKPDSGLDSLLYNGQYMLFYRDNATYDVLKYYYNINLPKNLHPITFDKYVLKPNVIFDYGVNVYALRNGYVYKYDKGYLDFAPPMTFEEDKPNYTYTTKIVTSNTSLKFPTHEKKIKEIYIKLYTNEVSLLSFSVILDGRIVIDPKTYTVRVNDEGELEYVLSVNPETLGNFEIGEDQLGGSTQQTHKVVVGGKGKNISLSIEQNARNMFGIVSIGYLYKLGKVREG